MFKRFILLFIFLISSIHAEIIEIKNIEEISVSVDKDTLVLLNIAEVLLDSQISLGSSPWRKNIKKLAPNWKQNPGINVHDRLTFFTAQNIPHNSPETITPQLIKQWQKEGIVVLALTSRGKSEWYDTQLEGVDILTEDLLRYSDIDFSQTKLPKGFDNIDTAYFGRGILYSSHGEKGDVLKDALKVAHYQPKKIILVDDKRDSLEGVKTTMEALGIPFTGYWYRRTSEDHRDFNRMVAHIQLAIFLKNGTLLTDAEALKIVKSLNNPDPEKYFIDLLNRIDWSRI